MTAVVNVLQPANSDDADAACAAVWPTSSQRLSSDSDLDDPIVSDLTDSVDDLGGLLASTRPFKCTSFNSTHRFPVIDEDIDNDEPIGGFANVSTNASANDSNSQTSCSSTSSGVSSQGSSTTCSSVIATEFWSLPVSDTGRTPPAFGGPSTSNFLLPHDSLLRAKRRSSVQDPIKRWSAVSITSTGTMVPADAVNCDCTSLAWATLRPNSAAARRRRQLRQRTKQDDDCYKKPTKEISSPDSADSGVASFSTSTRSNSMNSHMETSTMGDIGIPPSGKTWKRRRRRTLGVFLGNMMRKMFDIPRDKSPSRIELPRVSKVMFDCSLKSRKTALIHCINPSYRSSCLSQTALNTLKDRRPCLIWPDGTSL